jgi:hypothetical protein
MITAARFVNANGQTCNFNDNELPFNSFTTSVDWRFTERDKAMQHGIWQGPSYLGKRLFTVEGELLESSAGAYWVKRQQFISSILPRPHLGYQTVGTLYLTFDGINEELSCQCTLDGWPEMPLQALYPSSSKYQINWKAFDPRLYGTLQSSNATPYITALGGRVYDNGGAIRTYANGTRNYDTTVSYAIFTPITITNSGNAETYPVVTFYGPSFNPTLSNGTQTLSLVGLTLAAGEYVVVDMAARTAIKNSNTNVYNTAVGSVWWALESGNNSILYTDGSGYTSTGLAVITWRNAYMI